MSSQLVSMPKTIKSPSRSKISLETSAEAELEGAEEEKRGMEEDLFSEEVGIANFGGSCFLWKLLNALESEGFGRKFRRESADGAAILEREGT